MTDYLSALTVQEAADWYYRLADNVSKKRSMAKSRSRQFF